MYRLGQRAQKTRKRTAWTITALLLVAIIFSVLLIPHVLKKNTSIKQTAAIVTKVSALSGAQKTFDGDVFSISLPADWQALKHESQPYNVFRWQNKAGSTNQLVEVYVDTIPQSVAVNRVMAVQSAGDHMALGGTVSDNCVNFTKDPSTAVRVGTHAKWLGIDFLCDLANYERNVVGTSSVDGVNTVRLQGSHNGEHSFFISYTDHNINSDYTILYQAIRSFRVE